MLTAEQIILAGGLLVLAFAIIQGLRYRGGHAPRPPARAKYKKR